jgi:predicted Zn-dependent protease
MLRTHRRGFVVTMLAAALALAAERKDLKPGFNLFSKDQDVELGKAAAAEVEKRYPVIRNRELESYIEGIGRKLASQPEADSYPYSFRLVHDKTINAFALPGGPTYVHTGLILAAENEAQLAGVMAHEISHVALRHGTNQASKAMGVQLIAGLIGAGIGGEGVLGQLAQVGIGFGANTVLLKYSREAERQADLLGARLMSRAGYNPIEMARFFEKLEAEGGSSRAPEFFSSHPNPGNRVKLVEDEVRSLPHTSYGADSGQFASVQQRVRALGQPPTPRAQR